MKTLTVRLSDTLVSDIEAESRARKVSRSDVVRERLEQRDASSARTHVTTRELIRDLIGSVDGLPPDLSQRTDEALRATGYGTNRSGRHRVSRRAPKPA
jgi:hypothetical protein